MKNFQKIIAIVLCFTFLLVTAVVTKAGNSDSETCPVIIEITSDKSSYSVYDTAEISVNVKNISDNDLSNATVYISADNLKLAKGSNSNVFEIGKLQKNSVKKCSVSAVVDRKSAGIGLLERIILFFRQLFRRPVDFMTYSNKSLNKAEGSLQIKFGSIKATVDVGVFYSSQVNTTKKPVVNTTDYSVVNPSSTSVIQTVTVTAKPTTSDYSASFSDIISTGTYTMKATMKNNGDSYPITCYSDGNKYCVSTKSNTGGLSSMSVNFIYDGENLYTVFPSLRMYVRSESSTDDQSVDLLMSGDLFDLTNKTYIETDTVTLNGRDYVVEKYRSANDTVFTYYYLDGDIRIAEFTDTDGGITTIEISDVSGSVPANAFTIPSGYVDMTDTFG